MTQDSTIELVSLALDAALMRQTAIASNIAHANTRGYQTLGVNFEQQLNELSDTPPKPVYEVQPHAVSIDEQMALSVKNSTQYRALIKGLNHQLAIMKLAVQGNKDS